MKEEALRALYSSKSTATTPALPATKMSVMSTASKDEERCLKSILSQSKKNKDHRPYHHHQQQQQQQQQQHHHHQSPLADTNSIEESVVYFAEAGVARAVSSRHRLVNISSSSTRKEMPPMQVM